MRYAVLGDIHGNIDALSSVLDDVRRQSIDHLVLLGDYVGYYYASEAVITELQGWNHFAILGNHDRNLLDSRTDACLLAECVEKYGTSYATDIDALSKEAWAWLDSLTEQRTVDLGDTLIELCHGSPNCIDRYIYPDASPEILDSCRLADRNAVWMGHTHWPFLSLGRCWLLNPGSVGQARDIGGLASWCIFDAETQSISFRRTEYDTKRLWNEIERKDANLMRNREVLKRKRIHSW